MGSTLLVLKPLGYSWPWELGHWWLTLTAADQGAWISGAGSFAAAFVALHLARRAERRQERRQIERSRLVAAHLYYPIAQIRAALEVVAASLPKFCAVKDGPASIEVMDHATLIRSACTKTMSKVGAFRISEAAYLPGDVGEQLASAFALSGFIFQRLEAATRSYFDATTSINPNKQRFTSAHECSEILPMVKHTISKTDEFLAYCDRTFGTVDAT